MQVLSVTDPTLFSAILAQIDARLLITGTASPTGSVYAQTAGVWYYDTTNQNLYLATVTDGSTNPANTTWVQQTFNVPDATTSTKGKVQLATTSETQTGSNSTKAVTPAGAAATYAKLGANTDITAITGLTTMLARNQGGTGLNVTTTMDLLVGILPTLSSGQYLTNNGTTASWGNPGSQGVQIVSGNTTLSTNTIHVVTADSLTLTLPAGSAGVIVSFVFDAAVTVGPTINRAGSDLIEKQSSGLVCDVVKPFSLEFTNATHGWKVKK